MSDEPTADELREEQGERAAHERAEQAEAASEDEARAHERRADKAEYLREKLDEREQAERRRERD
jgi:hypothetical protein